MKSRYVDMLLKVVKGILLDAQHAYTNDGGFVKDFTTLTRLSNDRGLGLFQLDLPHLDDILTRGLRDGRLNLEGALTKRVSKRIQVPRLFSGLWLRLFDEVGCLKQDVDANAILFLRQLCCIGKKVEVPCSEDRLRKAVNEYRLIDQGLRSPGLSWQSDSLGSDLSCRSVHFCDIVATDIHDDEPAFFAESGPVDRERSSELLSLLQRAADSVCSSLESFNPISESCRVRNRGSLGRGFKHGPGAVAHASGSVDKYYWQNLPKKLLSVFPRIYYVPKGIQRDTCNHEVPSRLIAVPKTAKAPRLIAAEPVEHQFAQQLMLGWFTYQFRKNFDCFISLHDQNHNKDLALKASVSGQLATIDLSSASDRLSCWTVERIFRSRPDILRSLHACRTRWVKNHIDSTSPYYLIMRKYASQGTACTFPIQSLVFLVLVMAACGYDDYKTFRRQMSGRVRVFGDDIILPSTNYARLSDLLTLCQLEVNHQKSFSTGNFRESCGGDYYRGYDVTPVKVKRLDPTKPEGRQSLLDASNNFFTKGFWHAAEAVGYLLPDYVRKNLPVVSVTSGSPGLTSFVGSWYAHLPLRWDAQTSSVKYRCWGTSSQTPTRDRDGTSRLLKYLNEASIPDVLGYAQYDSELALRGRTRDRVAWRALEPYIGFRANRSY